MWKPEGSNIIRLFVDRVIVFLIATAALLYSSPTHLPQGLEQFLLMRLKLAHILLAALFLLAWRPCFPELYKPSLATHSFTGWFAMCVKGCTSTTFVLAAVLLLGRVHTPLAKVLPLFWFLCMIFMALRALLGWVLEVSPWNVRSRVLIVGTGPLAQRAWRELRIDRHRSVKVLGFVDSHPPTNSFPEITNRYLGNIDDLEAILLHHVVDSFIIAMPVRSCYDSILQAVTIAQRVGVDVVHVGSSFHPAGIKMDPAAHSFSTILKMAFKRVIDFIVSLLGILLLAPLLLLITLLIKVTSPGPALFVQERYGYRRRKFKLFKFRTMVVDAEKMMSELEKLNEASGPIFKMRNDPRITRLGRLLRKTSLDELPQLFNVLAGNMSLVGPRPMSLRDVSLFSESHLMRRFRAKPGITGLWQVSGRSNVSFDHWIAMDFRYIDNWSLTLDLHILLRTIPVVLRGSGAM